MCKAASQLSSINDDMGNQYLQFPYRLQLFLVKKLNDLKMKQLVEETGSICASNQKICRRPQTSFNLQIIKPATWVLPILDPTKHCRS